MLKLKENIKLKLLPNNSNKNLLEIISIFNWLHKVNNVYSSKN